MNHYHRRQEVLRVYMGALFFGCCLLAACSSSRYYVNPATEKDDSSQLAVLKLPNLYQVSIDDHSVTDFKKIYLAPGWHHISFGWPQNKGCKKKEFIKYYYKFGTLNTRLPKSPYPYDQTRCLEYRYEYVNFSGWWEFSAGEKLHWNDIYYKLTTNQSHHDEIDDLSAIYSNGDVEARRTVARRLGLIQNLRVFDVLLKALHDEEDSVKIEACRSLMKIDNQYAVPFIRNLLNESENDAVKHTAKEALNSLNGY